MAKSVAMMVQELADQGYAFERIARRLHISESRVISIVDGYDTSPNRQIILDGATARPGTPCPYSEHEMGSRCAWLAGHYDAHGFEAWTSARFLTADEPALWEEDRGN